MNVGDIVKVLPPFGDGVAEYTVLAINAYGVVFVEGIEGGFSPDYLEKV